jgi:hypothetical protein
VTTQRISVFHRQDDTVLSCVRDRVSNRHKVVVDSPESIRDALGKVPAGLVLDLRGHTNQGFLRFGSEEITADARFIAIFQALRAMGVGEVRLLGCEVGKFAPAAAAITTLRNAPGMPRIRASIRDLTWRDSNHAGLRPTSEFAVFDFPEDTSIVDPPHPLTRLFDESPVSSGAATRVTRSQVQQLESYLSPDYVCACPLHLGINASAKTLKAFEMEVSHGVGRARVVELSSASEELPGETMFVVAQMGNVEVVYRVSAQRLEDVRRLIAGW